MHVSARRCICVLAYSRSSPTVMLNGESGDPTGFLHYTQLYEMQTIKIAGKLFYCISEGESSTV